jgi:methylglyoxal synthase
MHTLGLVAHDGRKDDLLDWAGAHADRPIPSWT